VFKVNFLQSGEIRDGNKKIYIVLILRKISDMSKSHIVSTDLSLKALNQPILNSLMANIKL